MDLDALVASLAALPPVVVYVALFGGALVEYVFPPFPGDTVVVAGAALVVVVGWPLAPVLLPVTAGAVVGAAIDLWVGRWLVRTGRVADLAPHRRAAVDDLVARFERYGAVWLVLNRFLPGVRALFFVAAGLAGLRTVPVLLWATASATAWNVGLIALGVVLGRNVESLALWFGRYQLVVGVAVAMGVGAVLVHTWRVGRRHSH